MALIGNYNVFNKSVARFTGGGILCGSRANWSKAGTIRAFLNEKPIASVPNGCTPPYSWGIARKSGGMSCKTDILGDGEYLNSNLAGGLNTTASITGSGDITLSNILYIIVANATLAGSGNISSSIKGALGAEASLTGSGDIIASIAADLSMAADLIGGGDMNAELGGALQALAVLIGGGNLTSNLTGKLEAIAELSGSGNITTLQASAIWNMVSDILVSSNITSDITGKGNLIATPDGSGLFVANPSARAYMGATINVTGDFLTTSNVGEIVAQSIKPELVIINDGIKKASLLIPHSTELN